MASSLGSFCWFECGTNDVGTAKSFYSQLFGWDATDVPMPAGGEGETYTLLKVGGEDIAGMYKLAGPMFEGVPPHWISYVQVEDADATAERAESLGATVTMPPFDVPGVGRISFFADPSGAHIAIFQPGESHTGAATESPLGWVELHTRDTAAAQSFYTQLFGWNAKVDPSGHYTEFQVDGRSFAGMMAIPPEQQAQVPDHWLPYAMVDDCDDSLAKAEGLGAKVVVPAQDIPDVGRFAVIGDPAGARLAMIKLTGHAAG